MEQEHELQTPAQRIAELEQELQDMRLIAFGLLRMYQEIISATTQLQAVQHDTKKRNRLIRELNERMLLLEHELHSINNPNIARIMEDLQQQVQDAHQQGPRYIPPDNKRGIALDDEYIREIVEEWLKAKAEGIDQQRFCELKGIQPATLKRYIKHYYNRNIFLKGIYDPDDF